MTAKRNASPPSGQWAAILSASLVLAGSEPVAPLETEVAIGVADLAARASVCVDRHGAVSAAWRPRSSGPHRVVETLGPQQPSGFDVVR